MGSRLVLVFLREEAGSRPGGRGTFLCFAKEKYPKERRPAVWVPALRSGQLALLDSGGGPQNSLRSNNCGPDPASVCAAQPSQDGADKKADTKYQDKYAPWRVLVELGCLAVGLSPHPFCMRRGAEVQTDQGSRLSEPQASSSETPAGPSTAGCP